MNIEKWLEENWGLIEKVIRPYHRPGQEQELRQVARMAALRAIRSYSPGEAKLSTWVAIQVRGYIQLRVAKLDKVSRAEKSTEIRDSEETLYSLTADPGPNPEQVYLAKQVEETRESFWNLVLKELSPKRATILRGWLRGKLDEEIAREEGVSRQAVSAMRPRIYRDIRRLANREKILEDLAV